MSPWWAFVMYTMRKGTYLPPPYDWKETCAHIPTWCAFARNTLYSFHLHTYLPSSVAVQSLKGPCTPQTARASSSVPINVAWQEANSPPPLPLFTSGSFSSETKCRLVRIYTIGKYILKWINTWIVLIYNVCSCQHLKGSLIKFPSNQYSITVSFIDVLIFIL